MPSRQYPEVERVVSRFAAFIALVISLALPAVFALDEYGEAAARLEAEARLQAKAVTAFVGRNPTAWRLPTDRLRAAVGEIRSLGGTTRVIDTEDQVIVSLEAATEWPVLVRRAEFFDYGTPVGEVEVSVSVRNIVYHTSGVLGISVILGWLIYGPLRRIPLRGFEAATRELEISEARYRLLVEHAPVGIVKHRHGIIEFVNPAFVTLVGAASADELVGHDLLEFVPPEQRGEAVGTIVALSGGAATLSFRRQRFLRNDGSVVDTDMAGVSNREGNAWVAQVIVVDVTGQRQAQELVRRSRDRLIGQQRALTAITRSDLFASGDCEAVLRSLTEVAAEQLGVERVSLWRFTEARDAMKCVDLYERDFDRHTNGTVLPARLYPRYFEAIASEEAIVADDALTDELTRELAAAYLAPVGIGSMLDVPIRLRGVPDGVLCHEHVGAAISWTPEQRMFAVAMGNLAALALEQGAHRQAEAEARALNATLERQLRECSAELEEAMKKLEALSRTHEGK